jgi:hypothetical protein
VALLTVALPGWLLLLLPAGGGPKTEVGNKVTKGCGEGALLSEAVCAWVLPAGSMICACTLATLPPCTTQDMQVDCQRQ